MPVSCHRWKLERPLTPKAGGVNGLTAGPDIHRFSIDLSSRPQGTSGTWGASKNSVAEESGGTLNPLSLSLNPHQQFSPSPFLPCWIWLHKLQHLGKRRRAGLLAVPGI